MTFSYEFIDKVVFDARLKILPLADATAEAQEQMQEILGKFFRVGTPKTNLLAQIADLRERVRHLAFLCPNVMFGASKFEGLRIADKIDLERILARTQGILEGLLTSIDAIYQQLDPETQVHD